MENLLPTKDELKILFNLIGQELAELRFDGWSAQLVFGTFTIFIQPEELYFPTDKNPNGDIVTLRINRTTKENQQISEQALLTNCGSIKNIIRLESLVEIENPRPVEATKISEIEIPAGQGWNNNIYHPNDKTAKINQRRTFLGLQFQTDKNDNFTLYSDSVGFFVRYQNGIEIPDDLRSKCEKIEIKTPHNNSRFLN